MEYYNLIFAVFYLWRLAITTLDKQSCFSIIIFAVLPPNDKSNATSTQFESQYMTSYLTSIDTFYLVPFLRYLTSKFLGFDLDLWPL